MATMLRVIVTIIAFTVTTGRTLSQSEFTFETISSKGLPQLKIWRPYAYGNVCYNDYVNQTTIDHLSNEKILDVRKYMTAFLSDFVFGQAIELTNLERIRGINGTKSLSRGVKHPLVIYAPGYRGLPFENSLMCEMLASSGYVVAAIPSLGVKHKTDSLGLEAQIDNIQKAVDYLAGQTYVDKGNISLIGFSWGGLASIVTAMRNKSIKSVISLDGSIRFFYALAEKMPGFKPSEFDKPVLLFGAEGNDDVDLKFFDQLRSSAYLIKMKGFNHLDFMSYRFLDTPYKDSIKSIEYFKMLDAARQFLNANGRIPDSVSLKSALFPNAVYCRP